MKKRLFDNCVVCGCDITKSRYTCKSKKRGVINTNYCRPCFLARMKRNSQIYTENSKKYSDEQLLAVATKYNKEHPVVRTWARNVMEAI